MELRGELEKTKMIEQRIKKIEKALIKDRQEFNEIPIGDVTPEIKEYWHSKGQAVPILAGFKWE